MAAYGALVSLMHTIHQIQRHPQPPVSLDKIQLDSLTQKITFLQEFLEGYSHVGNNAVESRIADAAYAAEDVIESHVVDQIVAGKESGSSGCYEGLQKVIVEMDGVNAEVMEIKVEMAVHDHYTSSAISSAPFGSVFTRQNTTVGFDDVLYDMMDRLTGWELDCQIIAVAGMGGIGKTTVARNIYENQISVQHFDILAWATISQEYKMRDILLQLLQEGGDSLSQMNEYELGDRLHKNLYSRRYLIVIDDVWNIEVWDLLKLFFPDNNNGSRIILTTRLSSLGFEVANYVIELGFLDEANSWTLFCKNVFGDEDCPLEITEIGKKIVANCKGLPLSIIVIGGVLARSEKTQLYCGESKFNREFRGQRTLPANIIHKL